jgi:hypothetical protein
MKTYPHKLDDGRWVIQTRQGNELIETIVTLNNMDQVGWDSIDSLDVLAGTEHNRTAKSDNN